MSSVAVETVTIFFSRLFRVVKIESNNNDWPLPKIDNLSNMLHKN